MLNTIPAQTLKRGGISAVDKALENGPVHVIKNNRPQYVIMSSEQYEALNEKQKSATSAKKTDQIQDDLWDWLLNKPTTGKRRRADIDAWLRQERDNWSSSSNE